MSDEILGHTVRDKVSGYVGMATCRLETLSGMTQYGVTGRVKAGEENDGKLPETHSFDASKLEVIDGPYISPEPERITDIKQGDKVKSKITDFKGTVVEKLTYLNGCVHIYCFSDTPNLQTGEPVSHQADASYFVKTDKKPVEVAAAKTGGPSRVINHVRG